MDGEQLISIHDDFLTSINDCTKMFYKKMLLLLFEKNTLTNTIDPIEQFSSIFRPIELQS